MSSDVDFLFEKYADKTVGGGRSPGLGAVGNFMRRKAIFIRTDGKFYRVAIQSPAYTGKDGTKMARWAMCSGTIGGSEDVETITAPADRVP